MVTRIINCEMKWLLHSCTVEVWEWTCNFISHFTGYVSTYPCRLSGTFHMGVKSPLVLRDRNVNGVVYQDTLRNTLVPFARQHFGDNFRDQDNIATAQSPDCNSIEHLWDELWRAINNMDHPSHNLHELCQALLDQWASIPVDVMTPLIGRDRSYVT